MSVPTVPGLYEIEGYGVGVLGQFTSPGGDSRWLICTDTDHEPLNGRSVRLIRPAPQEGETMQLFAHTFRPWRVVDGEFVVASERAWRKLLAWNRDSSFLVDLGDARPRVLVDVDPFADVPGQFRAPDGSWCVQHREWGVPTGFGSCRLSGGNDAVRVDDVVARLFRLIDATQSIQWLIRTGFPERVLPKWPQIVMQPRGNVWLAATVTGQAEADAKIPELLKLRELCGRLAVHVVPTEEVDLRDWVEDPMLADSPDQRIGEIASLDWVTVAGEIGKGARPTNLDHVRGLIRQCQGAGVPVCVERLGRRVVEWCPYADGLGGITGGGGMSQWAFDDRNGADPSEWPEDLRVREVPT